MSHVEASRFESIVAKPTPKLLIVPETDEYTDYKSYRGFIKPGFKETARRHLDIVNAADFSRLEEKQRRKMFEIKSLLNRAWNWYENSLDVEWPSQDAINDSSRYFSNLGVSYFPELIGSLHYGARIEKLEDFFKQYLSGSDGPTVVLSETHATTTPLMRTLKQANPNSKIGMFVFDTHLDTDPGPGGDVPRKSNTLRLLVDKDRNGRAPVVDKLTAIGVPDKIELDHRGSAWGIEKFNGKVNVIAEEELFGEDSHNMSFSKKALSGIIFKEVLKMKKAGITNVMLSVDLDVLKSGVLGLTGFEYSAFHALLYLAGQRDLQVYRELPGMIYSLLTNTGFAGEINGSIIDYPITLGGRGLSVSYLTHGLEAIRNTCRDLGVKFGIKYENAQVFGDIVELSGPDYMDKTKKAVLEIAQAMLPK